MSHPSCSITAGQHIAKSPTLSLGSAVQLRSDPPRYGVVRWIGTLPGMEDVIGTELVTGVELVSGGCKIFARYFHVTLSFECTL